MYPQADIDEVHPRTRARFVVFGQHVEDVEFLPESSTIRVRRGEPYVAKNKLRTIDTEMVALDLRGHSKALGDIHLVGGRDLVAEEDRAIYGKVVESVPETFFPAENWFDVYVEVRTALGTFVNRKPEHMVAVIDRHALRVDDPDKPVHEGRDTGYEHRPGNRIGSAEEV